MQTTAHKHPVVLAIILTVIPVVFLSIAGVAIVITNADENKATVLQAIAVALSAFAGFILVKALKHKFEELGFCGPEKGSIKTALYFIPMIAVEVAQIIAQPITRIDGSRVIILLIFTLFVGLNEELYFRGLILRVLTQIGLKKAVIISSILFGVGHAASALAGFSPQYVVLQILFAFLFGFVATEFVLITKSILPMILWHFIHDFIGYIVGDVGSALDNKAMIVLAVQVVVLLATAVICWKRATMRAETNSTIQF